MPLEIERKFYVHPDLWQEIKPDQGQFFAQGYLCSDKNRTVRVRMTPDSAFLTIKGKAAAGSFARSEYEYEIPQEHAREMLQSLCESSLEKTRYFIPQGKHTWEVDVFHGNNAPLIIAEIELESEEEAFEKPQWIAAECTSDFRLSNSYLAQHPYSTWA